MQKLTDEEFNAIRIAIRNAINTCAPTGTTQVALCKLLQNYQEQLQAEFYAAERYTEDNTEPTLEVDTSGIVQESDSLDEIWNKTLGEFPLDSYAPTYSFKDEGR